jgi:hypothetical protein
MAAAEVHRAACSLQGAMGLAPNYCAPLDQLGNVILFWSIVINQRK